MKNFVIILLVLIIYSTHVYTQIDTTSLSYYPLNDGDYWEYLREVEDYWWPGTQREYYSHCIIGDTTFSNGEIFKIIKRTRLDSTQLTSYIYERVDSITCNVYRYDSYAAQNEYLIDSLKSQIGDSCNSTRTHYSWGSTGTICTFIRPDNILNRMTISKTFIEQHWHSPVEYKLSKGFGLTYLNFYFDFGRLTEYLLYARIDSVEYGTQVNSIPNDNNPVLNDFHLFQNYPNPFNPRTNIQFSIPKAEYVTLKIFNLRGQEIATLVSDKLNAGNHNYTWNASAYASGVYIIRLQSSNYSQIKKCLLIK